MFTETVIPVKTPKHALQRTGVRRCCAHPMNRALLLLLSFAASTLAQVSPGFRGLYDFQDDDIALVLHTLARQGNIKLIITSTVTLRVENKTPREVIDIIAASKNLVVNQRDGILYISTKSTAPTLTPSPK